MQFLYFFVIGLHKQLLYSRKLNVRSVVENGENENMNYWLTLAYIDTSGFYIYIYFST